MKKKKEEKEEKKEQIEIKEEKNDNILKEEEIKVEKEEKKEVENEIKKINKVSILAYTNTKFYDKDLLLNSYTIQRAIHSIDEYNNNISDDKSPILYFLLYNIYFNTLIYYEYTDSKYEALVNLTRRKHSK